MHVLKGEKNVYIVFLLFLKLKREIEVGLFPSF